ncbi:MAG: methyltransferase domain-containing protein [Thermoanaerobaculales bacterium]|nr:methyltransferase domain-containing protein [Thermoanaerobaculales bacterium]
MLTIEEQIRRGLLVCPESKRQLVIERDGLRTADAGHSYPMYQGVPIFLSSESREEFLFQHDQSMKKEYGSDARFDPGRLIDIFFASFGDQRSRVSREAWSGLLSRLSDDSLCVSIGGGPKRIHPFFVNLNIERFDNVDVVADAHRLPYADSSVKAIQCEAVLEHLTEPEVAVREMYRVLEEGGEVFSVTPFLQKFHAYPSHFYNPTLEGHKLIFEKVGFEIQGSGVCVGPSWMISDLMVEYVSMLVPIRGLRALAMVGARILLLPLRFLDILLNRHPRAHILASTTFVLAVKVV